MNIYMIPGLGFDEQIFSRIKLSRASSITLNWLEPLRNESIESYARRMSESISDDEQNVILVGHSFGGVICQEIAQQRKVAKVILISSIVARTENPWKFKIIRPLFLHKVISKKFILSTFRFWDKKHGFETPEEKALFREMVSRHSNRYLSWSLKELSRWTNTHQENLTEIVRLHGTKDRTFPIRLAKNIDYKIENGSHVMVYKKGEMISKTLEKEVEIFKVS